MLCFVFRSSKSTKGYSHSLALVASCAACLEQWGKYERSHASAEGIEKVHKLAVNQALSVPLEYLTFDSELVQTI